METETIRVVLSESDRSRQLKKQIINDHLTWHQCGIGPAELTKFFLRLRRVNRREKGRDGNRGLAGWSTSLFGGYGFAELAAPSLAIGRDLGCDVADYFIDDDVGGKDAQAVLLRLPSPAGSSDTSRDSTTKEKS